jgi:fructokinase
MITVIGESLVDIISDPHREAPPQAHPGGSPLNVAVGTARLGLATTLVTHYAGDPYGDMIEEHLSANGVAAIRGGAAPTSTATALLGPDGAATYAFNISWDINGAVLCPPGGGNGARNHQLRSQLPAWDQPGCGRRAGPGRTLRGRQ